MFISTLFLDCLSLDMEVQDLQHRVDDLHSGQRMTESKVETVLQMQHKILQKLESIEKSLWHPFATPFIFP